MTRLLRIVFRVVAFAAVFVITVPPAWWLVERLFTRDVSSEAAIEEHLFAVLVRQQSKSNRYAVDFYPGISPKSELVTDFTNEDLVAINRDLRASISAESSHYEYFRVLARGNGYVDVLLEAPTRGDFWRKNSYRIRNGGVHPQRIVFLEPGFAMFIFPLLALAGVFSVMGCERLVRRWRRHLGTPASSLVSLFPHMD